MISFTERDIPKLFGAVVSGILALLILNWMGVGGFAETAAVALIALAFFTDKFGGVGKWLRIAFIVALVVTVLFGWKHTKSTVEWSQNRVEEKLPRENFDPKNEAEGGPIAIARFYERPDGIVEKVTGEWKRNPITGEKIAAPGTEEFLRLLTKFEVQKAKKDAEKQVLGAPLPKGCQYCLGENCEVSHPGSFLEPGRFQIRSVQYGTTAELYWDKSGKGQWTQKYPKSGGTVRWEKADYGTGTFVGFVTDTVNVPGGIWNVSISCGVPVPPPKK